MFPQHTRCRKKQNGSSGEKVLLFPENADVIFTYHSDRYTLLNGQGVSVIFCFSPPDADRRAFLREIFHAMTAYRCFPVPLKGIGKKFHVPAYFFAKKPKNL